ncbi:lysis system i-spanin subunit Rz [Pseudomonas sp. K1(2024)]|uniref:Lysis system i-spanin subunit Rz n=1 Tax=Pseudomonas boreofloridensis TaxID=3064348 RepID=A0ABV4Z2X4_9PSED|nr:lysis system i-spanin subunit Rz [Pseudomonas sp. K13]MDO7900610.1 lysis system i-spanin subunit Rz [Pseudomonas sp. K13]
MSPDGRLAILALLLGACVGAWAGWTWQDWRYGQQLAEQAGSYKAEREAASAAVIAQLQVHQDKREELEARLAASAQTHWKEMNDAQSAQARLRDRLATADQRLSVLLDATSTPDRGCGLPEAPATGGVVHGPVRAYLDPAHAQRIVAITDEGDRAIIALKACQAYVRQMTLQ